MLPLIGFGGHHYLSYARQRRLASDIESGSGSIVFSTSRWTRWLGEIPDHAAGGDGRDGARGATVRLVGPTFDNDWVRERAYMRETPITSLTLSNCAISGGDLAHFVTAHPLRELRLAEVAMPTDVIDGISQQRKLRVLYVRGAGLTDDQFVLLPLEQYEKLSVELTRVTPAGLRQLRRCDRLSCLGIDGRQLDDETAAMLASMQSLFRLDLVGREVTDEQTARLLEMPQLGWLTLINTSVTPAGVRALKAAQPSCIVQAL